MIRGRTLICIRWKLTNRIEVFSNLGKLYHKYSDVHLGVSRWTLNRKDLTQGYQNDVVEIYKMIID